jgi:integrase
VGSRATEEGVQPISGHVFKRKGKRGAVWYAKFRLPDGRQVQRRLGPAWTEKTPPEDGYFTKRSAQRYLDELLAAARRGTLPGQVRTGKTFQQASEEWLVYCKQVRDCKASTLQDYRNVVRVLNRSFGDRKLEEITSEQVEHWLAGKEGSNRTRQKYLVILGAIFRRAMKAYGLPRDPTDTVERPRVRRPSKIDVLRPEEVLELVRAAASDQDAAIFHTAAFGGLRMGELLALRWRDLDFARSTIHVRENWTAGQTTTPKGGSERAVPMADEVAQRLARLGQRERFTSDADLVFCAQDGRHLGYKSLKARYRAALKGAGLRQDFRFHNLRHTFGSTVIRHADSREVMEWMGHADLATTRRYLAFVDREDAAKRVSDAFRLDEPLRDEEPERLQGFPSAAATIMDPNDR